MGWVRRHRPLPPPWLSGWEMLSDSTILLNYSLCVCVCVCVVLGFELSVSSLVGTCPPPAPLPLTPVLFCF
jgi:hypothetical protein